jgi:hypothetical protein
MLTEKDHAIVVTDPDLTDQLIIPLVVQGVTSTFPTRKPMLDEYNTCPRFTLTYDSPEFEPKTECFANMECDALSSIDWLQQTGCQTQQTHLLCSVLFPKATQMCNKFWNMRVKAIRFCSLRHYVMTLS